jgi:predicted transglutaminase-like cysteine proteinase
MQARFLLAVATVALSATPALADSRAEAPRNLPLGTESEAPRGYVEMCATHAQWCASPRPADPKPEPVQGEHGGSAFPMILSFNFAVPAAALEKAAREAVLRSAPQVTGLGAIAALGDMPRALAHGAASVTHDATSARLAANADGAAAQMVKSVNRRVNGAVVQRRDAQIYGQGELWRRSGIGPGATGDCEDIAIEKRLQLLAEGFPADKLAFAVVYRRGVGLHTVLLARTAAGDMVLDSLTPAVTSWDKARYSWISVQSMAEPSRWFAPGVRAPR